MSVYFVNNKEITSTLSGVLTSEEKDDHETVFKIICQPQAVFKVRCITRCTRLVKKIKTFRDLIQ